MATDVFLPGDRIAVDILEQLDDGCMRVGISWDGNRIGSDVRWCGTIHLHEDLETNKLVRVLVDQGLTPQKPRDPINFRGQPVFADPSSLVLQKGSSLVLGRRSDLVIAGGSTLSLLEGSELNISPRARIIIEPAAKIMVAAGAIIHGRGRIILQENGLAEFDSGSDIQVRIRQ